jgi:hypothetical protein
MSTKQKKVTAASEGVEFDVSKYLISADVEVKVISIPETGDEIELQVKPIPWSKRNKIISECLKWQDGGQVDFDGDGYVKACLAQMIVKAPWGVTDERFLSSIDSRLGAALESLVPKAFGEDQAQSVDALKKG